MSLKKSTRFIFFGFAFLLITGFPQISAQQVTLNDEWALTNSYGFPVWIAFNDLIPPAVGERREIFIFIEPQYFTPENIKSLFTNLAAEYKTPDWLDVTAFSDKLMLQRAINTSRSGFHIHWADTPEGREAAKKWAEEYYPLPSGYYRARYYRTRRNHYSQSYVEEILLQPGPRENGNSGDRATGKSVRLPLLWKRRFGFVDCRLRRRHKESTVASR
jgi:hypothetical protein